MAIDYPKVFHSKALQNFPKLGFFGLKMYHLATLLKTSNHPIGKNSPILVTLSAS
jgi:hypothetical protein